MAKRFKLRAGVVPVTICGETVLVAGREARGKCPYTMHLAEPSVFYFGLMNKGLSDKEMVAEVVAHYSFEMEHAEKEVVDFIQMLEGYGYLISEDCE